MTIDNATNKRENEDDYTTDNKERYKRGKHPNSQANLQPFERGISGNPGGRPTKYTGLKKALDKFADKKVPAWDVLSLDDGSENFKEAVLREIWNEARSGSISHIKILAELGCLDED